MTGTAGHAIRPLAPEEIAEAVAWAAREGWNPGLADAAAFAAQDRDGFLGLFVDGALAATISAVAYEGGFGFVGFYICRPDLRGRGLGLALWRAALARLAGFAAVGLDAVVAQQANYARSGFVLAHRNIRYGGPAPDRGADPRVVDFGEVHADAVLALDRRCFGHARPDFLKAWLAPPFGRACVFLPDGHVRGYGVVRRCGEGHKIGPLFAEDEEAARALFSTFAATARGETLFLDVPEPNAAARALAEDAGLSRVFETGRMYRGAAPDLPLARIFGITSFELG